MTKKTILDYWFEKKPPEKMMETTNQKVAAELREFHEDVPALPSPLGSLVSVTCEAWSEDHHNGTQVLNLRTSPRTVYVLKLRRDGTYTLTKIDRQ